MYKGYSKSSHLHPEKRAEAKNFCCGNTLPLFIKLEKLIQIFELIVHTKVRRVQQIQILLRLQT